MRLHCAKSLTYINGRTNSGRSAKGIELLSFKLQLLHEEESVAAEMAIRISSAVGETPENWLSMQQAVDLWDAGVKLKSNPALAPLFRQASIAA